MADTIQLRAGNKTGMPTLLDRELAYVRNENALYVGTDTGNKKIGAALEAAVSALQSTVSGQGAQIGTLETTVSALSSSVSALQSEKLSASKAEAQSNLAADAELATVVAAFNALVAAMKASGLMIT